MDNQNQQIINYLNNLIKLRTENSSRIDLVYSSYEELIIECGTSMNAVPLPNDLRRGIQGYCYANCQAIARRKPKYIYVEGFALSPLLPCPIYHAWLMDENENAIDPTWLSGLAYLGIPFRIEWVMEFLRKRKDKNDISIIEGNYFCERRSFLKEGLPRQAIAT